MNAWDHLPNARLIDRILASLKENPKQWHAARHTARHAARNVARNAAMDEAMAKVDNAACMAADNAACIAADNAARNVAWNAARDAILALIAYDDSAKYLDMTASELEMWAKLSQDPSSVLLIPAVQVFESINKVSI